MRLNGKSVTKLLGEIAQTGRFNSNTDNRSSIILVALVVEWKGSVSSEVFLLLMRGKYMFVWSSTGGRGGSGLCGETYDWRNKWRSRALLRQQQTAVIENYIFVTPDQKNKSESAVLRREGGSVSWLGQFSYSTSLTQCTVELAEEWGHVCSFWPREEERKDIKCVLCFYTYIAVGGVVGPQSGQAGKEGCNRFGFSVES